MKIHPLKKISSNKLIPKLKFSKKLKSYLQTELMTFRLYPGILDTKIHENKLPTNISKKIDFLININLNEIDTIGDIHHTATSKYHKVVFRHLIKLFIHEIIKDEYIMILLVKDITPDTNIIEGKYLSFSTKATNLKIIEKNISYLINSYVHTLNLFISLYNEHNQDWLTAYMELGRELQKHKDRIETNNRFNKLDMGAVNNSIKYNSKKQASSGDKESLIKNIKHCRDILINAKHKNPYALIQISKIYKEKFEPIAYTTLRDRFSNFGIPKNIKEFTKNYG